MAQLLPVTRSPFPGSVHRLGHRQSPDRVTPKTWRAAFSRKKFCIICVTEKHMPHHCQMVLQYSLSRRRCGPQSLHQGLVRPAEALQKSGWCLNGQASSWALKCHPSTDIVCMYREEGQSHPKAPRAPSWWITVPDQDTLCFLTLQGSSAACRTVSLSYWYMALLGVAALLTQESSSSPPSETLLWHQEPSHAWSLGHVVEGRAPPAPGSTSLPQGWYPSHHHHHCFFWWPSVCWRHLSTGALWYPFLFDRRELPNPREGGTSTRPWEGLLHTLSPSAAAH